MSVTFDMIGGVKKTLKNYSENNKMKSNMPQRTIWILCIGVGIVNMETVKIIKPALAVPTGTNPL